MNFPVANDDSYTVEANDRHWLDVLANDDFACGHVGLLVMEILGPGELPSQVDTTVDIIEPEIAFTQQGNRSLHGVCEPAGNRQRIRYTPDEGYFGPDQCAYRACDGRNGNGDCVEALISITVVPDDIGTTPPTPIGVSK